MAYPLGYSNDWGNELRTVLRKQTENKRNCDGGLLRVNPSYGLGGLSTGESTLPN